MNKKNTGFQPIRILLIIFFIIGLLGIAMYPFPNRNLTLKFMTEDAVYKVFQGSADIASGNCRDVRFDRHAEKAILQKVHIYGSSKSMLLKEIGCDELYRYIEGAEQGEVRRTEDGILVTGMDQCHLL